MFPKFDKVHSMKNPQVILNCKKGSFLLQIRNKQRRQFSPLHSPLSGGISWDSWAEMR